VATYFTDAGIEMMRQVVRDSLIPDAPPVDITIMQTQPGHLEVTITPIDTAESSAASEPTDTPLPDPRATRDSVPDITSEED